MNRLILILAVTLAALVAAASVSARSAVTAPVKLTGTVGPSFTIVLKKGKTKVSKLKPGRYSIQINDKSAAHNFHLTGPGKVNKMTTVSFVGSLKKPWLVTLKKGKYTYVCDPHATNGMKGTFTVS
jgi:plastocyanin